MVVEGDPNQYFVELRQEDQGRATADRELPQSIRNPTRGHGRVSREDLDEILAEGFNVDDDNEPAPENNDRRNNSKGYRDYNQEWAASVGTCCRKQQGIPNVRPKIARMEEHVLSEMDDLLQMYLIMLPRKFFEDVVIPQTNVHLLSLSQKPVTFGEFLRWIGIWFYMATCKGYSRDDFWSSKPINEFVGAPIRFNAWMSKRRFDYILGGLTFHDKEAPAHQDRFHFVRQLIEAWNENMQDRFVPGWATCLDESMSVWLAKHTCPGWMCVERKPHPFGNEYHSICCGLSGIIMFAIEICEGNDEPPEKPRPPWSDEGQTGGLLCRLTKSIHNTGKVVILDSGFSVLNALITLQTLGVHATAVCKKRRFWPQHCPGDDVNYTMSDLAIKVGEVRALNGTHRDVPYHIICMKEERWVTKLFATCGTTTEVEDSKMVLRRLNNGTERRFHCCDVFVNHYAYRHAVDDHNHLRQADLSLEETWRTHRWENRVFAFILAITEVNAFLAFRYFVWKGDDKGTTILAFRRMLSRALIFNECYMDDDKENDSSSANKRRRPGRGYDQHHVLLHAPPHASKFADGRWVLTCKDKCQQHKCTSCYSRIRTCCSCSPSQWMCVSCHTEHVSYCVALGL